jgi:glucose-1-phosphate adenylyltransferase
MDYAAMVAYHEKNNASCTIAVRNVPLSEASRFGILNTNPDNSIYEFEEKPKQPKSTNASMGIYVFNWKVLREALISDEEDETSSNDFGKNIIPKLLNDGHKMMAYTFDGYWKDVGTIDSLWEANMELLGKEPEFNIRGDERTRIYARNSALPSSYIDANAKIYNSFVAEGSEVYGTVRHSVISVGCTVGEGALVEDSVVMPGVVIESGAIVRHAILGENSKVCRNAVVGGAYGPKEKKKISVTSKGAVVAENTVLAPGDMV